MRSLWLLYAKEAREMPVPESQVEDKGDETENDKGLM
jgi:hypothetical protein